MKPKNLIVAVLLLFGSAILFGWTMYRLLDRAHTVVVESGCRKAMAA